MKVLFVHPRGNNWLGEMEDISSIFNIMPPHGMMSIAAFLEQRGIETSFMDCYARPLPHDRLVEAIVRHGADAIGFSCTTSSFLEGYRIAELVRERLPKVPIVFGGPHACSIGPSLLDGFPAIDFLVIGEGENSLYELTQAGFRNAAGIPGIGFRENGKGRLSSPRELIADLDTLPFPAYHRLPGFPGGYNLPLFSYPRHPNTSIISSRGCPYQCSYCDRSVFSRGFRFNSPEYIVEHLRFLHRDFGIRHVFFYDDLFTFDRGRVERFFALKEERKVPVTYNCIVRPEHLDGELVSLLKRSGCWQVNLGIESGDPELVKKHRKFYGLDEVGRKLKLVKGAGMRVKGLFMIGLPGETEESIRLTIDYALSLPLDEINVTKFTPFPGAPIYRSIREQGEFTEDWPKMNCLNFVFIPRGMTAIQLDGLYDEFISRFYRRTGIHLGYARMLWRSPHSILRFVSHLPQIIRFEMKQKW